MESLRREVRRLRLMVATLGVLAVVSLAAGLGSFRDAVLPEPSHDAASSDRGVDEVSP